MSRFRTAPMIAAAMALAMSCLSAASHAETTATRADASETLEGTPSPRANDPVGPLSALSVEGSQDTSTATLKFGAVQNWIFAAPGEPAKGVFSTYSLAITTPIAKKSSSTNQATLDGLAKSTYVTFQASRLFVPAVGDWGDGGNDGAPCKAMWAAYPAYKKLHPEAAVTECNTNTILQVTGDSALAHRYNDAADTAIAARGPSSLAGVFGKFGYEEYTFYDATTLAKDDLKRTPWQAGVYYARISSADNWAATGQYLHEESFKETDPKTACLAGVGPVLTCITGSIGRATRVSKDVFSFEYRWTPYQLNIGVAQPKFGVAPKVSYDVNNGDLALSLPVYLFGSSAGLTGGVRADWESKEHNIVVGLFLTKSFSVLGASVGP
jgi:hypothetical protein